MKDFHIILAATSSIILFIFGLENFSKEVQQITGERFRKFIGNATKVPVIGILIGAVVTAIIQSSSATSVIAISLVNAGVLSFKNSIGIIFGANIGTTVTAQLVAFKLTAFAPVFIILGFILSFIRTKYSVFAKSLFYFGFVFFSLNLISSTLAPLQNDDRLIGILTQPQSPLLGVLFGALITAVVQSSSVTTGLAIIFTQQGLMSLENAIPILMGGNLGTTVTALISIFNMDIAAKKTAVAHFFFNFGGVLIFLPIVMIMGKGFPLFSDVPAVALANFHLIFNLGTTLIFALAIKPFSSLIDKILGEGKMDFERFDIAFLKNGESFDEIYNKLLEDVPKTLKFVQENYNLMTLSIETNYKGVFEAATKRVEYLEYYEEELLAFFSHYVSQCGNEDEIDKLVNVIRMYEYIFQIHDSIKDLGDVKTAIDKNYIELKSDILLIIRGLTSKTLTFFEYIVNEDNSAVDFKEIKKVASELQSEISNYKKKTLKLMAQTDRNDATAILHFISFTQRLKDKLLNFQEIRH